VTEPREPSEGAQQKASTTPNGGDAASLAIEDVSRLSPEGKRAVAAATVSQLSPDDRAELAEQALQSLEVDARGAVVSSALDTTRPASELAAATVAEIDAATKTAARRSGETLTPEQVVINRIWQWVVGAFCLVFVGTAGACVAAVFLQVEQAQILLTIFTSTATLLAGLLAGRGLVGSILNRRGGA
jgi:hypothetical protein